MGWFVFLPPTPHQVTNTHEHFNLKNVFLITKIIHFC